MLASGDQDAVFAAAHEELSDPRQPTVLVVEDIHWADDATLDVLRFLGRRIATLNAVLLATYRDDAFSLGPSLRRLLGGLSGAAARRIPLHGLSPDAVTRMADGLPRGPQPATRRNPAGLTGRQAEDLRLLVDGLTNAEIAERLVVSVRTVDHHVSAALQKLGVPSRQAARDAAAGLDLPS